MEFYNRAKTICPHEGRIFYQLGSACEQEEDYLAATYFLMRALSCANPHNQSRNALITLLQEARMRDCEDNHKPKPASALKIDTVSEDYFLRFFFSFLRVQSVFYQRIGVDELEP